MTKKHKTVLVVEDSPVQALSLKTVLEQEGLAVFCALDGQTGISMAKQYTPDVVVLDIEMPGLDGFETCRRLKENAQTANIPVVMLTSHGEPAMLLHGIDRGAIDFIPKDAFSNQVLLETLRQLGIL